MGSFSQTRNDTAHKVQHHCFIGNIERHLYAKYVHIKLKIIGNIIKLSSTIDLIGIIIIGDPYAVEY
jgi:hypothetical protein